MVPGVVIFIGEPVNAKHYHFRCRGSTSNRCGVLSALVQRRKAADPAGSRDHRRVPTDVADGASIHEAFVECS